MFANILVPVDGSECALKAARAAAEIARRFDSQVTLLQVLQMPESLMAAADLAGMVGPDRIATEALQRAGEEALRAGAEALALPPERVKQELLFGHPAETIGRVAKEGRYDLIVMGSRGLTEVGAFFMGSVSDKVSHHAPCPVLIVR
jgi:nucleotide-binding universal stress UspA family protein